MNKDSARKKSQKTKGRRVAGVGGHKGAPRNGKPSSPTPYGTHPTPGASNREVQLFIDGGSRGNPGPAACAFIAKAEDGTILRCFSKPLGPATNNVAEYQGLVEALQYAVDQGIQRVKVHSDSQLLVCQMKGIYRVKSPDLKIMRYRASQLVAQIESFRILKVSREELREVDHLVGRTLEDAEFESSGVPIPSRAVPA
jgi:ribonuclease HI